MSREKWGLPEARGLTPPTPKASAPGLRALRAAATGKALGCECTQGCRPRHNAAAALGGNYNIKWPCRVQGRPTAGAGTEPPANRKRKPPTPSDTEPPPAPQGLRRVGSTCERGPFQGKSFPQPCDRPRLSQTLYVPKASRAGPWMAAGRSLLSPGNTPPEERVCLYTRHFRPCKWFTETLGHARTVYVNRVLQDECMGLWIASPGAHLGCGRRGRKG